VGEGGLRRHPHAPRRRRLRAQFGKIVLTS